MSPRERNRSGGRHRAQSLNPARLAAVRVLVAVDRGGHAEDLLAELAPDDLADRSLAWHLALGVLRRRGALDAPLSAAAGRPMERIDPVPRAALRVGLFELHVSRTPSHAAVSQAVEACRAAGAGRAAGFVNAVLRKAALQPLPDDPFLDLPPWLAERWAEHGEWVSRIAVRPPICGVWRDAEQPVPDLGSGPATAAGAPVPGTFVLDDPRGPIEQLPGFAEGRWWVMDPAAVAVADLCLDALGEGSEPRVLDACAAPGGKSFRLAARGARVVAVDVAADRLGRVAEGARRLALPVESRQHDWLKGPIPGEHPPFDAVLVDAPCSALGTVRRHPEVRWNRQASDPAAMAIRQRQLLAAAASHVAEGGTLVYAVCTPTPEEGEGVAGSLEGWKVVSSWTSFPPAGDEDAFQAFTLRRR